MNQTGPYSLLRCWIGRESSYLSQPVALALGGPGGARGRVLPADLEARAMAVSQITSNPGAGGRFLFCRKARGTDTGGTLILQPFPTFEDL
jgi:hypothetical protein